MTIHPNVHGLKHSISKTEILLLGTRQNTRVLSPVSVRAGGETIQESQVVKNSGELFHRHLTWDAHISDVVRKCSDWFSPPETLPPAAGVSDDRAGPGFLRREILLIRLRKRFRD